jgi:hypothetical protein
MYTEVQKRMMFRLPLHLPLARGREHKKRHGGHGGRGRHGGAGKDDIRRLGASNAMQVVAVNSSAPIAGAAVVAGLILVAYRRAAKKKYPSEDEIDPREIE